MKHLAAVLALSLLVHAHSIVAAGTYENPVIGNANTPDPGVIYVPSDNLYYVATTSNYAYEVNHFPIRSSPNLVDWTVVNFIFPNNTKQPVWARPGTLDFWAPEIHLVQGQYNAYYTVRHTSGVLAIGVAHATHPRAVWSDSGAPLMLDPSVGSIDSTIAYDASGQLYLVWKEDGNGHVPKLPTPIWAQPLRADGLALLPGGKKTELIRNTLKWEGDLVEGPWVLQRNGAYYLFYSANSFDNAAYAMGVARSKQLLGPYEKKSTPMVHSNKKWVGPGHCSVLPLASNTTRTFIVYHAWLTGHVGVPKHNRVLLVDELHWGADGWPYMATDTPSKTAQPIP